MLHFHAPTEVEGLARIGVSSLQLLIGEAGTRFDAAVWNQVCSTLVRVFDASTPHELLSCKQFFVSSGAMRPSATNVDLPGSARRLCRTPYGDGIVTSVRRSDGMASVSLSWGAVLHCPAELVGVTAEHMLEMTRQDNAAYLDQRATRHSLSPTEFDDGGDVDGLPMVYDSAPHGGSGAGSGAGGGGLAGDGGPLPFRSVRVVTQCVVQLELVATVALLCSQYLHALSTDNLRTLLTVLETAATFARTFNADKCVVGWAWVGSWVWASGLGCACAAQGGHSSDLRCPGPLPLPSMCALPPTRAQGAATRVVDSRVHALRKTEQGAVTAATGDQRYTTPHRHLVPGVRGAQGLC